MASEYLQPMLDVGSPRVFNCNVITRNILAKDPNASVFFGCKPMNKLVLIKDTVPERDAAGAGSSIGTKLYFPFNENDIYEGGRTIFYHDKAIEKAIAEYFGEETVKSSSFHSDMKMIGILDKLPSLDPFLMKDALRNRGYEANPAYFEISEELWIQIENHILQSFEPLVRAAYPDSVSDTTDDRARLLAQKMWEARDLDTLGPLAAAFQLPRGQELEIFAAWKGIHYYGFQFESVKSVMGEMMVWLKELTLPFSAMSAGEKKEFMAMVGDTRNGLKAQWTIAENIIREYQTSYDKLFRLKQGPGDFITFLKKSNRAYWDIGNALGKIGSTTYCWNIITKRHANRKVPLEPLIELILMMNNIVKVVKKTTTTVTW